MLEIKLSYLILSYLIVTYCVYLYIMRHLLTTMFSDYEEYALYIC